MENNIGLAIKSRQMLKGLLSIGLGEWYKEEIEFAIREVNKSLETCPITEEWAPNRCPTCNANLGGNCSDGYYENPIYEVCPNCRQRLCYE